MKIGISPRALRSPKPNPTTGTRCKIHKKSTLAGSRLFVVAGLDDSPQPTLPGITPSRSQNHTKWYGISAALPDRTRSPALEFICGDHDIRRDKLCACRPSVVAFPPWAS